MSPTTTWRDRFPRLQSARHWWYRHPRIMLAVRTALAAALAWYVAQLLPGVAEEYPYYAPMGAVATTAFSIRGSASESLRVVGAIIAGGLIGIAAGAIGTDTSPFVIAGAVLLAVLISGHRVFGTMGSWVPTVALFTLVVGYGETGYVAAYAGMTLLGAAIGVAVTLAMPQVPLAPAIDAVTRLRHQLADQLRVLQEGLESEDPPDEGWWERAVPSIAPARATMRSAMVEMSSSRTANLLARRYVGEMDTLETQANALAHTVDMVQDLADLVSRTQLHGVAEPSFGPALQQSAAPVLGALADLLDDPDSAEGASGALVRRAEDAVDDLVHAIDHAHNADVPGGDVLVASNLVVTVRRCTAALTQTVDPELENEPEDEPDAEPADERGAPPSGP